MIKKYILILLPVFWSLMSMGQGSVEKYQHQTWVMAMPQHLFQNAIRVEIDKKLTREGAWIIFAPTVYYRGQQGTWISGNRHMYGIKGGGLDVLYRYYPNGLGRRGGIYVSAGGGYRFTDREYQGGRWDDYEENGLGYYRYDTSTWHKQTQTVILKGITGYQRIPNKHFVWDIFLGIGVKLSSDKVPDGLTSHYTDDVYSLGGTGFLMVGGLRMGIGW